MTKIEQLRDLTARGDFYLLAKESEKLLDLVEMQHKTLKLHSKCESCCWHDGDRESLTAFEVWNNP